MTKPTTPKKSTTKSKAIVARKPRTPSLRTGPTAKDIDRLSRVASVAKERSAQISSLFKKVAKVAVMFEPVGDDDAPISAETIEQRLWVALTELTNIRP